MLKRTLLLLEYFGCDTKSSHSTQICRKTAQDARCCVQGQDWLHGAVPRVQSFPADSVSLGYSASHVLTSHAWGAGFPMPEIHSLLSRGARWDQAFALMSESMWFWTLYDVQSKQLDQFSYFFYRRICFFFFNVSLSRRKQRKSYIIVIYYSHHSHIL